MSQGREVTLKVNFTLGDRSAFSQASQQSDQLSRQTQANMRSETATAIANLNAFHAAGRDYASSRAQMWLASADTRAWSNSRSWGGNGLWRRGAEGKEQKGMLAELITGGLPGLLKGGLAGAGLMAGYGLLGTGVSDFQNFGAGGNGLRGHGFAGILDSIYGMISGRNTREANEDFRLQRGDYRASQFGTSSEANRSIDALRRQMLVPPNSEINPLERIARERSDLRTAMWASKGQFDVAKSSVTDPGEMAARIAAKRAGDFELAKQEMTQKIAMQGHQAAFADKELRKRIEESAPGPGADNIDMINSLKIQIKLQDDLATRAREMVGLREQQVQLENSALMSRKQQIKDDASQFGSMTPAERMFANSSAQRLMAGKQLTPEEIGSLGRFSSAKPALDKYLRKVADESGLTGFLGTVGDKDLREAAGRAQERNTSIEMQLDEKSLANAIWDEARKDILNLIKSIKTSTITKLELETKMENLQIKRQTITGTNKE